MSSPGLLGFERVAQGGGCPSFIDIIPIIEFARATSAVEMDLASC